MALQQKYMPLAQPNWTVQSSLKQSMPRPVGRFGGKLGWRDDLSKLRATS